MEPQFSGADRIRFLEDRLRVLSGSLRAFAEATTDYERLLDVVARTLARHVGDGCVVRLLSPDGWLNAVSNHLPLEHAVDDPVAAARVSAHLARPHRPAEEDAARQVIETGKALLIPWVDLEVLAKSATPEIAQAYGTIGIHSALLVALRVRGQSIGLLALVRFEPGSEPFGEEDLTLAQAIADHAALAISNARLLQGARLDLAERERTAGQLRKAESELRQAQKLEAVGRLAGGVAHDFNNILTVILTWAEIISSDPEVGPVVRDELTQIRQAGERASDLTRQLLAFSRQQVLDPRVIDLNRTVEEIERMLRRLLGEDIELVTLPGPQLWHVRADPGQIGQIWLNLAVNARDAMPQGGKLTIETSNVELRASSLVGLPDVRPGPFVKVCVSDDGVGMDAPTQARLFEPFFTTKAPGKGTGLGLAAVFGIVKQSGGHLRVKSSPGQGTTFELFFPRVEGDLVQAAAPEPLLSSSLRGCETVLLVEDDSQVRAVAQNILRSNGYQVLEAANAGEALLICEQHRDAIHLLLTDVVLPRMSGRVLAERLVQTRPQMKVLFTSGYTDDAVLHHGVQHTNVAWLQKPLTPLALTRKVREVLGPPAPSAFPLVRESAPWRRPLS